MVARRERFLTSKSAILGALVLLILLLALCTKVSAGVPSSSSSTTTQIHDAAHATVTAVQAGTTVHDFVTVTDLPPDGGIPSGNVNIDWFLNGTCTGAPAVNSGSIGPLNASGQLDATSFSFTVNTAGFRAFRAHYEGDAFFQPSNGPCEPLRVVDANIQITPASGTNDTGQDHVLTAHVNVNDGTGFTNAPDGTQITLTIDSGPGSFTTSNPCTTSGGTGSCQVTLGSSVAGVTTVKAQTTVTVAGVSVQRQTNGLGGNSGAATKTWVASSSTGSDIHNAAHATVTAVPVGSTVHDFVTVTSSGVPTGNVNIDWFLNGTCTGAPAVNSGSIGPLNASGQFDATPFNFTVNSAGFRAFRAHYEGDGTHHTSDGPCEPLRVVDAKIQISPSSATNAVNTSHVLTGHVDVNDGTGFVDAPAGTQISFSIDSGPGSFTTTNPCTVTAGGSCSITLTSATPGTTIVSASVTITVSGVELTRATNGVEGNSGTATKIWVASLCGNGVIEGGEQCDDGNTTDGDGCSSTCTVEPGFVCSGEPSVCTENDSCAFANPALGAEAASFCTILSSDGKVQVSGAPGQIQGNICAADHVKVSMSGQNFATQPGQVLLADDASCAGCNATRVPGGVVQNADLTDEINACDAARAANTPSDFPGLPAGSGPACTKTIKTLEDIVVGGVIAPGVSPGIVAGQNVVCITKPKDVKDDIRLSGDANTKYVFVVKGRFKYNGAKITTDCGPLNSVDPVTCSLTGVGPDDVLWLFVGRDQHLTSGGGRRGEDCCKAVLDGSVIIDGKVELSPGLLNGQICGTGDWSFAGGGVHCPKP